MKRLFIIFVLLWLLALPGTVAAQRTSHSISKVVLDAGHGGKDPGALGKRSKEKDITLAIALKTGKLIQENIKDVEVIYTRTSDVFIELFRRAQIANTAKADLFISIHCNAARSASPSGAETFVMGLHKSQENLDVAIKENAAILLEDNYMAVYEGFDPNTPEAYIIFSLYQNAYLEQSLAFSQKVQDQFSRRVKLADRGVKQAGFQVLYKTAMPGVLIETGFISNPTDEALLMSTEGQNFIASAIFHAFKSYKESVEKAGQVQQLAKVPPPVKEKTPENMLSDPARAPTGDVLFRVQFLTSPTDVPLNAPEFKNIRTLKRYLHEGMYKYTSGNERSLSLAVKLKDEMVKKGYKDAFVIAFLNEQRIGIDEAVKIRQQKK